MPGFQPELALALARGEPLLPAPAFGLPITSTALSGFQTSQTPSLPCTLQAVRLLPVSTTCARGQSHLFLVLLRKGLELSSVSASFLLSCCLFHPGCDL